MENHNSSASPPFKAPSHAGSSGRRRSTFLDKTLLYLFSYDVEVNMDRENVGFVSGGVLFNIKGRDNLSRAYHVLRERTIPGLGVPAVSGAIVGGGDTVYWRDDDMEFSEVRLSIVTDDGATIHGFYPVVVYLAQGGFRRLVSGKGKIGKESEPVEVPVVTTPRFETTNPTYAWINDLACVGYGRVRIVRSEFRRISYDIYALV